jgi:hypothetical protein
MVYGYWPEPDPGEFSVYTGRGTRFFAAEAAAIIEDGGPYKTKTVSPIPSPVLESAAVLLYAVWRHSSEGKKQRLIRGLAGREHPVDPDDSLFRSYVTAYSVYGKGYDPKYAHVYEARLEARAALLPHIKNRKEVKKLCATPPPPPPPPLQENKPPSGMPWYVYGLYDPRTNKPFYVGKGKNSRAVSHLRASDKHNQAKHAVISEIRRAGFEPTVGYLLFCWDETSALEFEAETIRNTPRLTNISENPNPPQVVKHLTAVWG